MKTFLMKNKKSCIKPYSRNSKSTNYNAYLNGLYAANQGHKEVTLKVKAPKSV